jgi:hypothetical protein
MELLEKVYELENRLSRKAKRDIHYRSVRNFIFHLDKIQPSEDGLVVANSLENYLQLVETNLDDINKSMSMAFYNDYIVPIGERYVEVGFIRVIPLVYQIFYSVAIDLLLFILFFHFPYPLVTTVVLAYHFLFRLRVYHKRKAYGMFY